MADKKPHRGHGEGSIHQRKDGRYQISISLQNGKRKTYYAKNKKEALEKLRQAQNEQQQGTLVEGPDQTLEQFLWDWLKIHKQSVRPRSYERYEAIIRLHLVPTLGKVKLQKLTAQQLDRLYAQKLEDGLHPTTVSAIHHMLHTALDKAIRLGLLTRNVCKLVTPPRVTHREMQPLTAEQIQKLLEAAKGDPLEALFVLAVTTGMRRGELFGLKWQDIDFGKGVLYVKRALVRMPTGEGYKETEPKTKKSKRSIVLTARALEALKEHRSKQLEQRSKVGDAWQNHDYVFCSPVGTHLQPNHNGLDRLKGLLQKAGLPDIRFHDLRHSTATLLLTEGVHPKIVQEILGHSDISMTMDIYSHVLPGMQQDAMDRLHDALNPKDEDDNGLAGAGVPRKPKK
jgi:integrase